MQSVMRLIRMGKPAQLTDDEFATMRRHPEFGIGFLHESRVEDPIVLDICLAHHEKVDDTGYPGSNSGGQISLYARMGTVCEVYDVLPPIKD